VEKKHLALIAIAIAVSMLIPIATQVYAQSSNRATLSTALPPHKLCNVTKVWIPFAWRLRLKGGFSWGIKGLEVVVSDEYKQRVLSILQSDPDVAELLSQGYNITYIKPVISVIVGGDGTVMFKATKAVVLLSNGGRGRAIVYVDVEGGRVLTICKCEVIVKSSAAPTPPTPSTSA